MCALCETFFTQESFRGCGSRRPAIVFAGRFLQDPFAGLLSPRPRLLSSRKESNQRFAKEEVSSLDFPLRGKTAPLLSALPYFFVCGPENETSFILRTFFTIKIPPRELREAKFSPPVCSASKQISGFASTTSGSRVPSPSAVTADT